MVGKTRNGKEKLEAEGLGDVMTGEGDEIEVVYGLNTRGEELETQLTSAREAEENVRTSTKDLQQRLNHYKTKYIRHFTLKHIGPSVSFSLTQGNEDASGWELAEEKKQLDKKEQEVERKRIKECDRIYRTDEGTKDAYEYSVG
ncbi:hypothetical protein Pmani_008878, partial [Petrolisthes manimaculis]